MSIPVWAQVVYLLCAVAFILALKGLSGPRTARTGNLIGAAAAVVACALPFFYLEQMDNVVADPGGDRDRHAGGRLRRPPVQMTQMPQMVALFNGVGGGAAALVAVLELDAIVATGHDVVAGSSWWRPRSRSSWARCPSRAR